MLTIQIKNLTKAYKIDSMYIFKFKDLSILGSYIKNENNIHTFEIADVSYEMLLNLKIKPNESICKIMKNGPDKPILKEEIDYHSFIF